MSDYLSKLKEFFISLPNGLLVIGISIVLWILIFVFSGNSFTKPSIATVDITGIVQQFVQSQAKLNLPSSELQKHVNAFGHQLEITLQALSDEKHLVIMPQEAVLAGSMDLTSLIKQRLQDVQEMPPSLSSR